MELLLSAIGALTGVGALAWGIWSWRSSGPRIIVRTETVPGHELRIFVINKGRSSVQIVRVSVNTIDRRFRPLERNPRLPLNLGPHAQIYFIYQAARPLPKEYTEFKSLRTEGSVSVMLGNYKSIMEPMWTEGRRISLPMEWYERLKIRRPLWM
jgi:hypothetical protein